MADVAIGIHGVTKRFGSITAVDRVSLDIGQGVFFALLGPSGSGKTTLLRIIAGLEVPDEGRILVNGEDVTRLPPYARGVGMVFQDFLLFPHKTVGENITFPLKMQGVKKSHQAERLGWIVRLLRIDGLEERYPSQLSGGQQQRVALARGLISRPALLLLDEPLANLDRELRKEMEVEVRRYQVELGIPFVYVTHNQEEALIMSDRIAVMREGGFDQVAPTVEIYTHPATPFVASFVGHSNRMAGRIETVDGALARIDWNGLPILVPRPAGAPVAAAVEYFIKCEHIRIEAESGALGAPEENSLRGTLRDVIFKGQTTDYIVVLENDAEIVVSDASGIPQVGAGARVTLRWPAGSGTCFRVNGD